MNLPLEPPIETPVIINTAFDLFWRSFPLKVSKGAARKAWDKATAKVDPEVIITGAINYARDPNRHPSFTAHPATWLNAERWGDEPLPPLEISTEQKRVLEAAAARLKTEKDRADSLAWFAEQEAQKGRSVPMPENLKKLVRQNLL
jgi:hypothetical protein